MEGYELIGRPLSDVPTPALVIDVNAMDSNIQSMSSRFSDCEPGLRPHAKTHKSPVIARKQLAAGAVGITCAKLGEAFALQAGGIDDILIANQVIGPDKVRALAGLARHATLAVAVDSEENARQLSAAAVAAGSTLRVLVEINVGLNRCGVEPGEPAVALATLVSELQNLDFYGIQAYEGHLVTVPDYDDRVARVREAMAPVIQTRDEMRAAGLYVPVVTGGATGTFDITSAIAGFDDIQAGSYVFMDAKYSSVTGPGEVFAPALFLWSTIISRPDKSRAVGDIGLKTASPEHGMPKFLDFADAEIISLSEEHIKVEVSGDARQLCTGDKVRIQPGHVCTTVNLHDRYIVVRGDTVESVWPVAGRGKAF